MTLLPPVPEASLPVAGPEPATHSPAAALGAERRTGEAAAIAVVYVIPLLLTVVGLWVVGLRVLAGSLLVIEAALTTIVVLIRRRPPGPRTG